MNTRLMEKFVEEPFLSTVTREHSIWQENQDCSATWKDETGNTFGVYKPPSLWPLVQYCQLKLVGMFDCDLINTYWYSQLYLRESFLVPHTDKSPCEISLSINLWYDETYPYDWYLHVWDDRSHTYEAYATKPGDALLYDGRNNSHWRSNYMGKGYQQVFVHFVRKDGECFNTDETQKAINLEGPSL